MKMVKIYYATSRLRYKENGRIYCSETKGEGCGTIGVCAGGDNVETGVVSKWSMYGDGPPADGGQVEEA